ncbi:MAG TPA: hypothetical protein DER07_03845 [Armatimonadetes bacterium]|nr:hypothetical protein [Armatimonadota bacterium]
MGLWAALAASLLAASLQPARVVLAPIDDRPATGQFARMIGAIAGVEVQTPPPSMLGRFTTPGDPDAVLSWLERQELDESAAVVVSAEMVCFGGLVASRTDATPLASALARLDRLRTIRRVHPQTPFYVFATIPRVLPTATVETAPWRDALGTYVTLREQIRSGRAVDAKAWAKARRKAPMARVEAYDRMRRRNEAVLVRLIEDTAAGVYDYLTIGQDDAASSGPHVPEGKRLRALVERLGIGGKVYFCEGIDQHSSVLVSRAALRSAGWQPRVRIVLSDPPAARRPAPYESKPLAKTLEDQLLASGARPAEDGSAADYTLFVNTPKPPRESFESFCARLVAALEAGDPCAVADVNLGEEGIADERLFRAIWQSPSVADLLAYAGWNTAGNTMGTTIPAANLAMLARRAGMGSRAEAARRTFLLHRFANDFAYHKLVRPIAYNLVRELQPRQPPFEVRGEAFALADSFVRRAMRSYVERYFRERFQDEDALARRPLWELTPVDAGLPWPRVYEVRLEFEIRPAPLVP